MESPSNPGPLDPGHFGCEVRQEGWSRGLPQHLPALRGGRSALLDLAQTNPSNIHAYVRPSWDFLGLPREPCELLELE